MLRLTSAGMNALPSLPESSLTASGTPLTAEQINATTIALKKALTDRSALSRHRDGLTTYLIKPRPRSRP